MADAAQVRLPQLHLPRRFGWLIAALGWEAAGYASHLEHLLSQPDVAAVLAACPRARRVLRPVAHMLRFKVVEPVEPLPADAIAMVEPAANFPVPNADTMFSDGRVAIVAKIEKSI